MMVKVVIVNEILKKIIEKKIWTINKISLFVTKHYFIIMNNYNNTFIFFSYKLFLLLLNTLLLLFFIFIKLFKNSIYIIN